MTHKNERVLSVRELSRVEGEGALYIKAHGGTVADARLDIYEPPRFFEAFLRGRSYTEPPDITARICGICPAAYQLTACAAIEDACGVTVGGPLADLRRLLYCGEWIESHALHIYLLHAPDFLGYASGIEMAASRRDLVERGLALKKAGNAIMEVIGGRAIHPVNVRLGGFYRVPARAELVALAEPLRRALDGALDTVRWVAGFDFPGAAPHVPLQRDPDIGRGHAQVHQRLRGPLHHDLRAAHERRGPGGIGDRVLHQGGHQADRPEPSAVGAVDRHPDVGTSPAPGLQLTGVASPCRMGRAPRSCRRGARRTAPVSRPRPSGSSARAFGRPGPRRRAGR